ncbi:MAG: lysylphosphatidylglycerol synthase domain-containing protein, partial [Gaiellales bacterium]
PPAVPLAALGLGDGIWIVALGVGIAGELGLGALARRFGPRARRAIGDLAQGVRVLRSPLRYVRTVLSFQALAWCCRIGVVYSLLHAFGITAATLPRAALVLVVGGMSTLVPVPGGAGSQQALAVFVLSGVAGASAAFSYSVGAQIAVTLVNTTIGAIAAMLIFGRLHPLHALRDAVHATRAAAPIEPVVATSQTSA